VSITVVTRRRIRLGQEDAYIAAVSAAVAPGAAPSNRSARVLRNRTDPQITLTLTEWDSRDAFDAERATTVDHLTEGPAERYFCRMLREFRIWGAPLATLGCAMIEVPEAAIEDARNELTERIHEAVMQQVGPARRTIYQDLDTPSRFVAQVGWRSAADQVAAMRLLLPKLYDPLLALGATVKWFCGIPCLEVERSLLPETRSTEGPLEGE
jgi:quinol monooxygenase YgiN